MLMNTLTDDELRRLIDTEPRNLAAVFEGARRFVGQDRTPGAQEIEDADREGHARGWDEGYDERTDELETMRAHRDRLQKQLDDLMDRIRGLMDA